MRGRKYILEVIWDTGDIIEDEITEMQLKLLERYKELYILIKYSLDWAPDAKPQSWQVWEERPKIMNKAHLRPKEVVA